jgi:hypothetical protein
MGCDSDRPTTRALGAPHLGQTTAPDWARLAITLAPLCLFKT